MQRLKAIYGLTHEPGALEPVPSRRLWPCFCCELFAAASRDGTSRIEGTVLAHAAAETTPVVAPVRPLLSLPTFAVAHSV